MITITTEALEKEIQVDQVVGRYTQDRPGPALLVTAGLHGNEPSGVFALKHVFDRLQREQVPIQGTFLGLACNLPALAQHVRYIDQDMNRIFHDDVVERAARQGEPRTSEEHQLAGVMREIEGLTHGEPKPTALYFIDCHTTSAESLPYTSVPPYTDNEEWALRFPLHVVTGLEKALHGTLAEQLNHRGWTGLTFEAGQHDDLASIEHQEACVWLALVYAGLVQRDDLPWFAHHDEVLKRGMMEGRKTFRVVMRHRVDPDGGFRMEPGFVNFQPVTHNQVLAHNRHGPIRAEQAGRILMPLYQKQGDDGFFLIEEAALP